MCARELPETHDRRRQDYAAKSSRPRPASAVSRGSRSTRFLFLPLFRGTRRISVDYRPEQSGAGAREEGEGELKTEQQARDDGDRREKREWRGKESKGKARKVGKRKRQQTGESVAAPLARQHVKRQERMRKKERKITRGKN